MTTIRPQQQPARWLVNNGEYTGMTLTTELTGVADGLPVIFGEGEQDYLAVVASSDYTPPVLPDSGWLELGEVYSWRGQIVMVRQAHERTIYLPDVTPALFLFRGDGVNWIAGEQVHVGTRRDYEGVTYECIQAHVTQADWTPPVVPALWRVYVPTPEPGEAWAAGVYYPVGHLVTYGGNEYECIQAHTSQVGWEPPNVPALWSLIAPPSAEWQPYTAYAIGDEVTYNEALYQCRQAHTSLPGWQPPNVPALWLLV